MTTAAQSMCSTIHVLCVI